MKKRVAIGLSALVLLASPLTANEDMHEYVQGDGTAMGADTGLSPAVVGSIIGSVVIALVGGGYGIVQKAKALRVEPQPLEVKSADNHYVTRKELDSELRRLYDLQNDNTQKLNQIIGMLALITPHFTVTQKD